MTFRNRMALFIENICSDFNILQGYKTKASTKLVWFFKFNVHRTSLKSERQYPVKLRLKWDSEECAGKIKFEGNACNVWHLCILLEKGASGDKRGFQRRVPVSVSSPTIYGWHLQGEIVLKVNIWSPTCHVCGEQRKWTWVNVWRADEVLSDSVLCDKTMAISSTHGSGVAFFEFVLEWQSLSMVQGRVYEWLTRAYKH